MTRHFLLAALLALPLAACGGGRNEEEPAETQNTPESADVTIIDDAGTTGDSILPPEEVPAGIEITRLLGTFDGEVTGLAFARNPSSPASSTLLAANGEAGIALIPLAEGAAASIYDAGGDVRAIATSRMQGNALVAFETVMAGQAQLSVAGFTASRDDLVTIGTATDLEGEAKNLCFTGENLFRIQTDGTATHFRLQVIDGGMGLTPSDIDTSADARQGCEEAGKIVMPQDSGAPSFFLLENGSLQTGETLFSFTLDNVPVRVTRLEAGAGNFGGIYRNGVMAVLTEQNELGLVSWLAVANYLDLPAETVDPSDMDTTEVIEPVFRPEIDLPILEEVPTDENGQ